MLQPNACCSAGLRSGGRPHGCTGCLHGRRTGAVRSLGARRPAASGSLPASAASPSWRCLCRSSHHWCGRSFSRRGPATAAAAAPQQQPPQPQPLAPQQLFFCKPDHYPTPQVGLQAVAGRPQAAPGTATWAGDAPGAPASLRRFSFCARPSARDRPCSFESAVPRSHPLRFFFLPPSSFWARLGSPRNLH